MRNPVIYTSVYGSYDDITPVPKFSKYKYVCITDEPDRVMDAGWEVIYRKPTESIPVRNARFVKIHPHLFFEDHDVSLWVDGNVNLVCDPEPILTHCLAVNDIAMFKHTYVKDLLAELTEAIRLKKDSFYHMTDQVRKYMHEGLPLIAYPHFMTMFIARRHNADSSIKTMEKWWEELSNNSYRDQLSFTYSCWKSGTQCTEIMAKNTDFFKLRNHKK